MSRIQGITRIGAKILKWIFLFAMALFAIFPLLQVLLNTFRTDRANKTIPIGLPDEWIFSNYSETWHMGDYGKAYINSFVIALAVLVVVLTVVSLAAYALSKLDFKFKEFFLAYFFIGISLPVSLYIIPNYFLMNSIGLVNTKLSLIIIYSANQICFNILLLRTFLGGIPREIEESAKIDGCSEIQSFLLITVPIAKSMFMTISILVFQYVWNEFLWANTFITTEDLKPVSTRFVKFTGQYGSNMSRIYTASVIAMAPIIVLYILFSRKFIEGMASGSVKA